MSYSLDDIRKALQRPPHRVDWPEASRAAVAAMFTPDLDLLLIRRARFDGDPWSGHVSFPGGRMDPGDDTPLDAAIRETEEELGIVLTRELLLGELDEIPTLGPLPKLKVHVFVFALPEDPDITPNYEVASVHRLALDRLVRGEGRGQMSHQWRGEPITLARVDFDGVRLWGLTLRMVDDLLHRLDGRGLGLSRPSMPVHTTDTPSGSA